MYVSTLQVCVNVSYIAVQDNRHVMPIYFHLNFFMWSIYSKLRILTHDLNLNVIQAVLGTNPLTLAAPAKDGDSFVLDMATTAVALGKVQTECIYRTILYNVQSHVHVLVYGTFNSMYLCRYCIKKISSAWIDLSNVIRIVLCV